MKHVFILLPALIHVYIFVLESFLWGKPRTNKTFGLNPEGAEATRGFAFNQGFYNLFLALGVLTGWVLALAQPGNPAWVAAGTALEAFGLAAMFLAGLVLILSAPARYQGALIQMIPATAGFVAVILA